MTNMDAEGSRIRDVVRDSKIHWDDLSKINQKFDVFAMEISRDYCQQAGRVFPRTQFGEIKGCYEGRQPTSNKSAYGLTEKGLLNQHCPYRERYESEVCRDGLFQGDDQRKVSDQSYRYGYEFYNLKSNFPSFSGTLNTNHVLDWIDAVDDHFDETNPPEDLKCQLAATKLKGQARTWWKELQNNRLSEGKDLISSWFEMSELLFVRFSPSNCSIQCPSQNDTNKYEVEKGCNYPDKLYCSMSDTKITANETHVNPIEESMNYISSGTHNFQQQSVGSIGKEYVSTLVQLDAPKKALQSIQYGYGAFDGAEVECIASKQHVKPWESISELEAANAKEPVAQNTIQGVEEMEETKGIKDEISATKSISQVWSISRVIYATLHDAALFEYKDHRKVSRPELVVIFCDDTLMLDDGKKIICLTYGEYASSSYSVNELVTFLFDPGGTFCSKGTRCTGFSIKMLAEVISFRNVHAMLRCRDRSSDMLLRDKATGIMFIFCCYLDLTESVEFALLLLDPGGRIRDHLPSNYDMLFEIWMLRKTCGRKRWAFESIYFGYKNMLIWMTHNYETELEVGENSLASGFDASVNKEIKEMEPGKRPLGLTRFPFQLSIIAHDKKIQRPPQASSSGHNSKLDQPPKKELQLKYIDGLSSSTLKNSTDTYAKNAEESEQKEMNEINLMTPEVISFMQSPALVAFRTTLINQRSVLMEDIQPYLAIVYSRAGCLWESMRPRGQAQTCTFVRSGTVHNGTTLFWKLLSRTVTCVKVVMVLLDQGESIYLSENLGFAVYLLSCSSTLPGSKVGTLYFSFYEEIDKEMPRLHRHYNAYEERGADVVKQATKAKVETKGCLKKTNGFANETSAMWKSIGQKSFGIFRYTNGDHLGLNHEFVGVIQEDIQLEYKLKIWYNSKTRFWVLRYWFGTYNKIMVMFLFDPGGSIYLSSTWGFNNYLLFCANKLHSDGNYGIAMRVKVAWRSATCFCTWIWSIHGNFVSLIRIMFIKNLDALIVKRALQDTFHTLGTIMSKECGLMPFDKGEAAHNAIHRGMMMNDKNSFNANGEFIAIQLCVAIFSCLSIVCEDGKFKKVWKLFHKLVNGLDPPKDLDDGAYEIYMPATYHVSRITMYLIKLLTMLLMQYQQFRDNSRTSLSSWGRMEMM